MADSNSNLSIRKISHLTTAQPLSVPVCRPVDFVGCQKGSLIYNPDDKFVYVYDGSSWDRVSGVNNPIDNLLQVGQNHVPRWVEDFPPGGAYTTAVLQDSSLEIDNDGNAVLNDMGDAPVAFPWTNGNMVVRGTVVTSRGVGISTNPDDPMAFVPILSQMKGALPTNQIFAQTAYNDGSTAVGYGAMNNIATAKNPISKGNTAIGTLAAKDISLDATDNTAIGVSSLISVTGNGNVGVGAHSFPGMVNGNHNVGVGSETVVQRDVSGATVVGSKSEASRSGNVIIGYSSTDGGHNNVIALGSGCAATGPDRIVLGSGVRVRPAEADSIYSGYVRVQIGDNEYDMPLFRR